MKFLINKKENRAINIANVTDIVVSANYLVLTTIDGREEKFIYGAESDLASLFDAVMAFIASDHTINTFDCDQYMISLR